ncbi:MAG: FAD-dependent oxidoreductase [Candidatus Acidiferrales bacterium]
MTDGNDAQGVQPSRVQVFGRAGCAAAYAIRDFLHRCDVPFEWVELKTDEQSRAIGVDNINDPRLPVCVFADGARMQNPTLRQITEKLGWFRDPSRSEYEVAIYGAGPAGLSAAVYAASEGLATVLIERSAIGGQAASSPKIENYLGFPSGIRGADLAERAREQAYRFGAEILLAREGVRGEFSTGKRVGYLADGSKIIAGSAICATGTYSRRLDLPGEERFHGAGVYYGAGASEASLCGNEHVFIVGGGNSAGQAALHFVKFAQKVTIVVRDSSLKSTLSSYLLAG